MARFTEEQLEELKTIFGLTRNDTLPVPVPVLVIGDHLVPMPVRDAAEMKNGDDYYIPCLDSNIGYLSYTWSNHSFDIEMCDKGLVHRTKEAASAHTGAFIAISKKKD